MANDRSDPWPTLVLIGVICGIAVGALVMLLRRREGSDVDRLLMSGQDFAMPLDQLTLPQPPPSHIGDMTPTRYPQSVNSPLARTQYISSTQPTFLLKATGPQNWIVRVRVIGPPGSLATFTYSGSSADQFVLPSGGHDTLMLPGFQSLYAIGNVQGVSVSVSGGESDRA